MRPQGFAKGGVNLKEIKKGKAVLSNFKINYLQTSYARDLLHLNIYFVTIFNILGLCIWKDMEGQNIIRINSKNKKA